MYKKIDNLNIYFQKTGQGKDLIMLHGWGLDVSTFWPVVDLLKNKFTLWLIDLPGHGRSGLPKKTFTISDFAAIIEKFIKQQKIKKPILLGHSFGGRIAIRIAGSNSRLLEKIILEDSAGVSKRNNFKNAFFKIVSRIADNLIPNSNFKAILKAKLYRFLQSDYQDTGSLRETFKQTIKEDLTDDLGKITLPALIIWGGKDKATPLKDGKKMYQLIKNAKLVILEGVGHAPHHSASERFAYYVQDFS